MDDAKMIYINGDKDVQQGRIQPSKIERPKTNNSTSNKDE